jgi:lipid kinase YegS
LAAARGYRHRINSSGDDDVPTRLILNGKKAGRADVRAAVAAIRAAGHELDVRVTWERGDAARLVAEAAAEGVARVIAGGGDGSVNEVAAGIVGLEPSRRPALGILPLGTANDFATACGIPADPVAALRLAVEGRAVPADVGRCNEAVFVNVASGGFGAAITADTPVPLKNFLGGGAYTLMGLLKAIDFRPYEVAIRTPAGAEHGAFVVAAICNGRQAGGGQPLAPAALIDDGLLDAVFLRPFPVTSVPQVIDELLHRRDDGAFAVHRRLAWVEIEATSAVPVNLDGEPLQASRLRFSCEPAALTLVVPLDCPCLSGPGVFCSALP